MTARARTALSLASLLALASAARAADAAFLDFRDVASADRGVLTRKAFAVVDGAEIGAADVLPVLFLTHTDLIVGAVEQAMRRRLMLAEAEHYSIRVARATADAEVERVVQAQSDQFELVAGPGEKFESYIQEHYDTDAATYRVAVRAQVLEELFLTRVIRYEARLQDRNQVRIIVLKDPSLAEELRAKLSEGANFAALAKKESIDRSAAAGGLFPPLAADCPNPLLAGVGALQPGDVSAVSVIERDGVKLYRILKLEKRLAADRRPFPEQETEIEAELRDRPLDPYEIFEWDRRVRARHQIEVRLGKA